MLYLQCAECNKKTPVYEWRNLELLLQLDRVGCCSEALNLRLGGAVFESRLGYRLYILFLCFYSIPLRRFDSPMVSFKFFFDIILPAALGPGVDSVSNRNECEEYFLGGKGG
jgi:hypothetical protein